MSVYLKKFKKVLQDWEFLAVILAAISIIITAGAFSYDLCKDQYEAKDTYLNNLNTIRQELRANNATIIAYSNRTDIFPFQLFTNYYYTSAIENAISEGKIRNQNLIYGLYNFLSRAQQANRIFDQNIELFNSIEEYNSSKAERVFSQISFNQGRIDDFGKEMTTIIEQIEWVLDIETERIDNIKDSFICGYK